MFKLRRVSPEGKLLVFTSEDENHRNLIHHFEHHVPRTTLKQMCVLAAKVKIIDLISCTNIGQLIKIDYMSTCT